MAAHALRHLGQSAAGAILAGALIWAFQWHWVDPVINIFISVLVLASSWGLLKETVAVLMESAPGHINVDAVHQAIRVSRCALGA